MPVSVFDSMPPPETTPSPQLGRRSVFDELAPATPKKSVFDGLPASTPPSAPIPTNLQVQPSFTPAIPKFVEPHPVLADVATQARQIPTEAKAEFAKTGAGLLDLGKGLAPYTTPALTMYTPPGPMPQANELRAYAHRREATLQPPQTLPGKVVNKVGSTGAQLAPALVAGGIGGPPAAAIVGGAQMGGNLYEEVYQRNLAKGMTPQDAERTATLAGTGGLVVGGLTGGLVGGGGNAVAKGVARHLFTSGIEGVAYGGLQAATSEAITSAATGDEANYWRVPQDAGMGGAINVGLTLLGAALTGGKARLLPRYRERVQGARSPAEVQAVVDEARATPEGITAPDATPSPSPQSGQRSVFEGLPGPAEVPASAGPRSVFDELAQSQPAGTSDPGTTPAQPPEAFGAPVQPAPTGTPPAPPVSTLTEGPPDEVRTDAGPADGPRRDAETQGETPGEEGVSQEVGRQGPATPSQGQREEGPAVDEPTRDVLKPGTREMDTAGPVSEPGTPPTSVFDSLRARAETVPTSDTGVFGQEVLRPASGEVLSYDRAVLHQLRSRGHEQLYAIDRDGKEILSGTGWRSVVVDITTDQRARLNGSTVTHGHPNGGTFSETDLLTATHYGVNETRVVKPDGSIESMVLGRSSPSIEEVRSAIADAKRLPVGEQSKAIADALGWKYSVQGTSEPTSSTPAPEAVGSKEANNPENMHPLFGGEPQETAAGRVGPPPDAAMTLQPDEGQPRTSARKAMMAEDRKVLGLDELPEAARRSWQQDLDAAREQGIPDRALDLAHAVVDTPRALSDVETAGVVEAAAKLKNKHASAMEEIGKLADPVEIRAKSAEALRIQQDFDTLTTAAKLSGTEKGRALAAQKLTLGQDYQLISVKNRAKAAKGGELSAKESDQLAHMTAKLQEADTRVTSLEKQMAEQAAEHERMVRELESKRAHARIKGEAAKAKTVPVRANLAERIVKRMESDAEKSRDALKALRGRMFSGVAPDPTVVYHLAKIAAAKIARGGYEFIKFSKDMIAEFGAKIGPHLKESWSQAEKMVRSESGRERSLAGIKARADEGAEVGRHVQALARGFVAEGITNREPLIDAVHAEVQKVLPDFTRDQTMDAISGYGDYRQLSKDEISVKLRDLKGQMQNLGKLRDLEAKLPPQKTGVERRIPSPEERQLIKQVNDLLRRTGIQATDPATQLKSALDGIKTRLTNEIADLDLQMATGKQAPQAKTPVPYDAEANRLKADRDAKKAEYDQVFGGSEKTDAERVKVATAAAEKSIADLERRIRDGDIAPRKAGSKTPETPELKAVRDRRDALQKRLDDMREAANPAKGAEQVKVDALQKQIDALSKRIEEGDLSPRGGKPTVDTESVAKLRQERDALGNRFDELRDAALTPEHRIQQAKDRLAAKISELTDRIAGGDFRSHTPAKATLPASKELDRLAFERDRLRKQIDMRISALKPKSVERKVWGAVTEPFNVSRAIKTSIDFSAPLRQGAFIAMGHPVRAAKSFGPMFRAFGSEQYAHRFAKDLADRPNAPLYAKAKLYLAERDGPLSAHEEGFMSRWAGHIPGVKASERAYNTFLNKLRADSFDAMTSGLTRNGEPTLAESKAIANYINKATGRGGLGSLETAATGLAQVLFSPRYLASRLQLLAGEPLYGGSAATRKVIAADYARFLIGLGVVYALGAAAGGTIEKDPRSSDFAKIRFGNTRLDPGTGLSQYVTFVARMVTGETKSSVTGEVTGLRGKTKYGAQDAGDVILRFVRSKLAPLPSTAVNLATGKDAVGQPVTLGSTAQDFATPLGVNDIYQAMRDQGLEGGTIIGLLALFGMGTQTYTKNEPERHSPR